MFRAFRVITSWSGIALLVMVSGRGSASVVDAWGSNGYGQLGNGTWVGSLIPLRVVGLTNVSAVSSQRDHCVALKTDGTVWCWGRNANGELGNGTTTDSNVPLQVPSLSGMLAVGAGGYHTLAVAPDRTVWAWGYGSNGELGDNSGSSSLTPVQAWYITDAVAVAAGAFHSLALGANGTVWGWGYNYWGQAGPCAWPRQLVPFAIPGMPAATAIAAGDSHSVARCADGTVWTWGYNVHGQLGDGTTTDRSTPGQVPGLTNVKAVACGIQSTLALKDDGTVWAWGRNGDGELGDGTTDTRLTPVQVVGLTDVVAIEGGLYHGLAVKADGTVWAWGYNYYGQLGDGTTVNRRLAVQTLGLTAVRKVAGGYLHSLALARFGTTIYVPDRTGTITENVALRGYLRRAGDSAPLPGKVVAFSVAGTGVGNATTGADGKAELVWRIDDGPGSRAIDAAFAGDADHTSCSGSGTLTCLSWATKMATFNRTARITDRTELKARLLRSDNVPLYNKSINFYVDGTFVITRLTNVDGYASYPYYTVPDGAGAGTRTILSEWPGNGGYAAISKTATLTVNRAIAYIWVLPKTVPQGAIANLYAYFRRLYDYQKQENKTVDFKVDGTVVQTVITGTGADAGIARYLYQTTEPVGVHTIRCEFYGDAVVDPGYGEGNLTIY